tara:strand:+ start:31774 stop:32778 length:1005 start_codon:yes stop_codon:yes gene_type:complete
VKDKILTGVTTTGVPHLGNYVGAMLPAIKASKYENTESFFLIADYHSLVKNKEAKKIKDSTLEIAASWLAVGLDDNSLFYRQSDIPEIMELNWILSCSTAKGLMNRAHAYKSLINQNQDLDDRDVDKGINMGLYCYPILMAADILIFNANKIPVGKDQLQHIEMTRDIANRFNYHYGDIFELPQAILGDQNSIIPGIDGRKMSKSYSNTIPLFIDEKRLKKLVMRIKTDSKEPGEPKDYSSSNLFSIFKSFARQEEVSDYKEKFKNGISWGDAKNILFDHLNDHLKGYRENYNKIIRDKGCIENILKEGSIKAREISTKNLEKIRSAIGIKKIS